MGRNRRHSLPQVRLHSGSGHARVRINGTEHWLGRFGSPEAQAAYDRLLAEYFPMVGKLLRRRNGRRLLHQSRSLRQCQPAHLPTSHQSALR